MAAAVDSTVVLHAAQARTQGSGMQGMVVVWAAVTCSVVAASSGVAAAAAAAKGRLLAGWSERSQADQTTQFDQAQRVRVPAEVAATVAAWQTAGVTNSICVPSINRPRHTHVALALCSRGGLLYKSRHVYCCHGRDRQCCVILQPLGLTR